MRDSAKISFVRGVYTMKDEILLCSIFVASLYLLLFFPNSPYVASAHVLNAVELAPRPYVHNPYAQAFVDEFERKLDRDFRISGTPGAAVVVVVDSTAYLMKGFGVRKKSGHRPKVDEHTVFRLGSVSKGFASILAGIHKDRGLIEWDEPVRASVPEFSLKDTEQGNRVSLRHVLSHTTGISYHAYTSAIEDGWSLDQIMAKFPDAKLSGEEGVLYSYQNAMYSMVQKVLENKTGKEYKDLMQEDIFDALGMEDASVTYEGIKENENTAYPHKIRKGRWRPVKITKKYYNAIPAGGVNASISDMGAWLNLLLGNRDDVISDSTLAEIYEPYVDTRARRRYFGNWTDVKKGHYGMGYRIVERSRDTLVAHGGYVNSYKADISLHPKEKIGVCILSNSASGFSSRGMAEFWDMYEDYREDIQSFREAEGEPIKPVEPSTLPTL